MTTKRHPFDPDLLITDPQSIFQSKACADWVFKAPAPVSASQRARDFFAAGDVKSALQIVSGWRPSKVCSKAQLKIMSLGYECLVRPDFYRSLGRDVDACVAEAKRVFLAALCKEK